jgi:hypothetical protein
MIRGNDHWIMEYVIIDLEDLLHRLEMKPDLHHPEIFGKDQPQKSIHSEEHHLHLVIFETIRDRVCVQMTSLPGLVVGVPIKGVARDRLLPTDRLPVQILPTTVLGLVLLLLLEMLIQLMSVPHHLLYLPV